MLVTADARNPLETASDLLVVPIAQIEGEKRRLGARVTALDRALGGRISAVLDSGDFRGSSGQQLLLYPNGDLPAKRVTIKGQSYECEGRSYDAPGSYPDWGSDLTATGYRCYEVPSWMVEIRLTSHIDGDPFTYEGHLVDFKIVPDDSHATRS